MIEVRQFSCCKRKGQMTPIVRLSVNTGKKQSLYRNWTTKLKCL